MKRGEHNPDMDTWRYPLGENAPLVAPTTEIPSHRSCIVQIQVGFLASYCHLFALHVCRNIRMDGDSQRNGIIVSRDTSNGR